MAIVGVVLVLVGALWLVSYAFHRDAENATRTVVGGFTTLLLGVATVIVTAAQEGAFALALVGDMIGANAAVVSNLVAIGLGYLVTAGSVGITPETWIFVTLGALAVLLMLDRRASA